MADETTSGDALVSAMATVYPLRIAELWRDANLSGTRTNANGQTLAEWQYIGDLAGRVQTPGTPAPVTMKMQSIKEQSVADAIYLTRYGFGVSQYQQARAGDRMRVYLDFERTKQDIYVVIGQSPSEGLALDTTLRLVRVDDGQGGLPVSGLPETESGG